MATYPERREDGSIWEIEYDPTTDAILGERMVSGPTGGGVPLQQNPQNAVLNQWMSSQAQQQAYSQAMKAADDAYRQAALQGQNEASARSAAINAGSNALSGYISLLNAYGGSQGLDVNSIAAFIRGEGDLSLPSGPTLEGRKTIAELQANPRDIFKLAAYQAGMGGQPAGAYSAFGASPNEQQALAGFPGLTSAPGTGGGGFAGATAAAGVTGGGVSLEQARRELTAAAGGPGWAAGTYGPGTPGFTNTQQGKTDQEIADSYYRMTGKLVQGFAPPQNYQPPAGSAPLPGTAPVGVWSPALGPATRFVRKPDLPGGIPQEGGVIYGLVGDKWYAFTKPEDFFAAGGARSGFSQAGGPGAGSNIEIVQQWPWMAPQAGQPPVGGTAPAPPGGQIGIFPGEGATGPRNMPGGIGIFPGEGATGPRTMETSGANYNPALYNLPQFQELRQRFGSTSPQSFPFAPQVPLPQTNQIPLGYMTQQSPFNRNLLEAAYSTAGLSKDVFYEPFLKAERAFGGGGGGLGY